MSIPEAWLIAPRADVQSIAAATVDAAQGLSPATGRTTTTYCPPRKHPSRNEWAYPIDAITRASRPGIEAATGLVLDWLAAELPTLISGQVSIIQRTVANVGVVTVVRQLDESWAE